jgi:cell division protein FtsL|tara:strand:+ start:834 stop:1073 length:240 start_codon:yes stop_codon:yes gene_type:complete
MSDQNNNLNIKVLKEWFTFIVAIVATIAGVIFWVQSINDPKFERLEQEIQTLKSDISEIRNNNNEILRTVGRIEGKISN